MGDIEFPQMNKFFKLFLAFLIVFLLTTDLKAANDPIYEINLDVNNDEVRLIVDSFAPISYLPDSILYPLVLIKEDFEEALKPNQLEKIKWKIIISNKRLKEAYTLLEQNKIEPASNNILAYISSLEAIKESIDKLKTRGDMPVPVIDLENNLTTQQKILTVFYNRGIEMSSSNALKSNINLINQIKNLD